MTIQNEIRMKEKDAYDRGHAQGTEQMASIVIRNMLLRGQSDEDIMSITECSKDKIDEVRRTM